MATLPITSREYKLTLKEERFADRPAARDELLQRIQAIVADAGGTPVTQAELGDDPEKKRRTWFLDTHAGDFRARDFILRVRREKAGEFAIALKFRGPDRYLSAAAEVTCAIAGAKLEAKFEEDILTPFVSKFSRSNAAKKLQAEPQAPTVGTVAGLFPVLGTLGMAADTPVEITGGFQAFELVERVGGFRFDAGVDVKMSFTFWYDTAAMVGTPKVAELSFTYDGPDEEFPIATVRGASQVFRQLQQEAEDLVDSSGKAKSDFGGGVV